jgi:hypothetical protein
MITGCYTTGNSSGVHVEYSRTTATLLREEHLPCLTEWTRRQSVQIHSTTNQVARVVMTIPHNRSLSRIHCTIQQRDNLPTRQIKDREPDIS